MFEPNTMSSGNGDRMIMHQLAYNGRMMGASYHPNDDANRVDSGKRQYGDFIENYGRSCSKKQRSQYFPNLNDCETIEEVVYAAFEYQHLSPSNMAAVWTRLSRLLVQAIQARSYLREQSDLHQKLNILTDRTMSGIEAYRSNQLAETALSMAKIIRAVRSCGNGRETKYHQIFHDALVGRDMERKQRLFRAIASAAVPLLPQFDPRGYSNLAYACAIAEVAPKAGGISLYDHIADAIMVLEDLRAFKPQTLSITLWAYATAKVSHTRLFDKVAYEVIEYRRLSSFKPQGLSNLIWAYATAKVSDRCLFEKLAEEVAFRHLGPFKSQAISNIVWAFAASNVSHPLLFQKMGDEVASRHLKSFNPQTLSNIVWVYAKAGHS